MKKMTLSEKKIKNSLSKNLRKKYHAKNSSNQLRRKIKENAAG